MQTKTRFLLFVAYALFCFALTGASVLREIPEGITNSFKKGNSKELARHFNNNIELVILGNEDVYSKSQAEIILREFFSVNKPVKFELLHQGGRELSRYAIGNLQTKNGDFRIYFLLKLREGVPLIHLLRIERVEEAR